jgi:phage terminase Nu1 subunit (DNA packaging protein)
MPEPLGLSLGRVCTHQEIADLLGISRARATQLAADGVFEAGRRADIWLRAYVERLREQAAGRDVDASLANERALLARSQRVAQEIKNKVLQGEYAQIGLLADILGTASAALAERLEALPSRLKMAVPELPDAARAMLELTIATARDEWVLATGELVEARLDALADDQADDDTDQAPAAGAVNEANPPATGRPLRA